MTNALPILDLRSPYNMRHTGLDPVDGVFGIPVTFQASFGSDTLLFVVDFIASWATPIALTFIEAARSSCSTAVAFPAILGLFYKTRGTGIVFPFFWLTLILSGHTRMDRTAVRVDRAKAEAALFAVLPCHLHCCLSCKTP
jgi:hypothetical protein